MKYEHEIYVEIYGRVRSGDKVTKNDYGGPSGEHGGWVEYGEREKIAIALAVEHAKKEKI